MHSQYFALINSCPKLQFCAKVSFSLLLILLVWRNVMITSLNIINDRVIEEALSLWEQETNLKFVRTSSGKVHIEIRFERGRHGDEDDFDGQGGTLAHAFFPIYGGDVHFDDDERWTDNFDSGTNLLMTASHELGHSLGLAHSDVRGSVMSPFYTPYKNGLKLHKDDIEGIQALYGARSSVKRCKTRPGVDKVKPKRWFKYSL